VFVRKSIVNAVIVAGALLVATLPLVGMRAAIDAHANAQARDQLTNVTGRMIAHADSVLAEASDLLSMVAPRVGATCDPNTRAALAQAAYRTSYVRDVVVIAPDGAVCRGMDAAHPLEIPHRFRTVRASAFSLGVVDTREDARSQAALLLKDADRMVMALLVPDALRLDIVPVEWRGDATGSVQLDDGTPIGRVPLGVGDRDEVGEPTEAVVDATSVSATYPISASMRLPTATTREAYGSLTMFVNVGGVLLGLVFVGLVLTLLRRPATFDSAIERGLRRREFIPFYQPCFDVATGALVGCEVLIRWRKPDGSLVPPGMFIQRAEETGLAVPMTVQLMEKARDEMAPLYGPRPSLKMAINLFADHFSDMSTVETVRDLFRDSPVRYSQLVFEVTERYPLPNLNRARTAIAGLQELGCRVALDDAGTGSRSTSCSSIRSSRAWPRCRSSTASSTSAAR
jgi:sensor c-di-GMP phosphodiesterase-like protein